MNLALGWRSNWGVGEMRVAPLVLATILTAPWSCARPEPDSVPAASAPSERTNPEIVGPANEAPNVAANVAQPRTADHKIELRKEGLSRRMGRLRSRNATSFCLVEAVIERDGSVTLDRILLPDPPDPELEEALFESFTTRIYEPPMIGDDPTSIQSYSSMNHCPVRFEDAMRDHKKRPLPSQPRPHQRSHAEDAWLLDGQMSRPVLLAGGSFPTLDKLRGAGRSADGFCPTRVRIDEQGALAVLGPRFQRKFADTQLDAALAADLTRRKYQPARLDGVVVAVETVVVPRPCPTLPANEPPIEVVKPVPEPDCSPTPDCPCNG
jgi:hypothetical protein